MRIINYTLFMLCLSAAITLQAAQEPEYTLRISNDSIKIIKGKIAVSFRLDLGEHMVYNQHKRIITPVICTHDYKTEVTLPAVIINGRNRSIKEQRSGLTGGESENTYIVLTGNDAENKSVNYHIRTDYIPWMEQARLIVRQEVTGCACGGLLEEEQVLKEQLLYIPHPKASPEMECPKDFVPRKIQKDAFLIYPVNQTRLYPERYGNAGELEKIDSAMVYVQQNPDYEIRHIDITGFASPEGSYAHNVELAEGRAESLRTYICQRYQTEPSLMEVRPGAENWEGLKQVLSNSQLPYKDEILQLIDSIDNSDLREEAIRRVGGGQPYRTLLNTVYPNLRKNTFTISYISKERTLEEARKLADKQPQELNAYEFYNVAHRFYTEDKEAYRNLLLEAADTYPDNAIACNNAAGICLETGNLDKAEMYLNQTGNEPFTWNNRALLLWKKGKKEEALIWWKKAAAQGDQTAQENLKETEKR